MTVEIPEVAVPGQPLTPLHQLDPSTKQISRFQPGDGAVVQEVRVGGTVQKVITATLVGRVEVESTEVDSDKDGKEEKQRVVTVSVVPPNQNKLDKIKFTNHSPKEGDVVLARITRLSLKQAYVEILAIEGSGNVLSDSGIGSNGDGEVAACGGSGGGTFSIHLGSSDLGETFKGVIRSQDVRSTERDRVKIIESFRPNDIVRAQVISLGDGANYYLTTARNDLGVVFAKAHNGTGGMMYAIDWQTMVCPSTGELEQRKCAKPF